MSELNNTSNLLVEPIVNHSAEIIKVIGVGGGGGNAVGQMYREGIEGVRFLVCNTDQKALEDSVVPDKIQLGPGLGAGGQPVVGQDLAEKNLDKIDAIFDDKVKMVFITAGMGGGTGTGASPVIAREARAHGVLTVGIVTIPFLFERERQIDKALDGLERLGKEVDAMLVINNQRLSRSAAGWARHWWCFCCWHWQHWLRAGIIPAATSPPCRRDCRALVPTACPMRGQN